MTSRMFFIAVIIAATSLFAVAPMAHAQNLSAEVSDTEVELGEAFQVMVNVDDATGVAGAALTLEFPDAFVANETNEAGEDYFVAESDMFVFVQDTRNPPGDPASTIPCLGNKETSGQVMVSGAFVDINTGGGAYTGLQRLFTINLKADASAIPGFYKCTWKNSELFNPAAGWGTDVDQDGEFDVGVDSYEAAPALVGAVEGPYDEDLSDDFPILLDQFTPFMTEYIKIPDHDSINDEWEQQQFGDLLNVATDETNADGDGYLDRYEQPAAYGGNDTDPHDRDLPYGPNYDGSIDQSGPWQHVYPDPVLPDGPAGQIFSMDVNYDTSNGGKVDGLILRIHYDSNKLTWDSFSDLLATGLPVPFTPTTSDDTADFDDDLTTDTYVAVEWDGADWPDAIPQKLYGVNFLVAGDLEDDVTSTINFTFGADAPGYTPYTESATFTVRSIICGDVNGDEVADSGDAILILQYSVGLTEFTDRQLRAGNVNGDGAVDKR